MRPRPRVPLIHKRPDRNLSLSYLILSTYIVTYSVFDVMTQWVLYYEIRFSVNITGCTNYENARHVFCFPPSWLNNRKWQLQVLAVDCIQNIYRFSRQCRSPNSKTNGVSCLGEHCPCESVATECGPRPFYIKRKQKSFQLSRSLFPIPPIAGSYFSKEFSSNPELPWRQMANDTNKWQYVKIPKIIINKAGRDHVSLPIPLRGDLHGHCLYPRNARPLQVIISIVSSAVCGFHDADGNYN